MRRKCKQTGIKFIAAVEWILGLIYPVRCPFCDEPVPMGEGVVCSACLSKVRIVGEPYCLKCGKQLSAEAEEYCTDCTCHSHFFERGRSLFVYENIVRESVYRFKYGGRREYARAYAYLAERQLGDFIRSVNPDVLIPVPLHSKRLYKRGYNQAELLAKEIGRRMGIPILTDVVKRVQNTQPQKELDVAQRQNNLKKAFKINRNDVKLYTTIIIDDIYTTGSTMDALSALLKEAGAERVFFLCLAGGGSRR